jgi:hypothetical protein
VIDKLPPWVIGNTGNPYCFKNARKLPTENHGLYRPSLLTIYGY